MQKLLIKDGKPIAQKINGIQFPVRKTVDKAIDRLIKDDIIEEEVIGATTWVSAITPVPKENGVGICVDSRAINTAIERAK